MPGTNEFLLTNEGKEQYEKEYRRLLDVERPEVIEQLQAARAMGDLSENAEYDAAKEEQAELEERINKLETMIRNAKVIDEDDLEKDVVNVGNTVTLKENGKEEVVVYQIVGSTEADPFSGRISNESEVGKALIGAKIGETVEVEVPDGKISYDILKVSN